LAPGTPDAARQAIKDTASNMTLPAAVRESRLAELRKALTKLEQPAALAPVRTSATEEAPKVNVSAEALESRRRTLTRELFDQKLSAKDREAKSAELREIIAQQATSEERDQFLQAPIGEIRSAFGIDDPKLGADLSKRWNEDTEAEVLSALHFSGVAKSAAKELHSWWSGEFRGAMGDIANVDPAKLEADFRERAKTAGVKPWLVDEIVKREKARLFGGAS